VAVFVVHVIVAPVVVRLLDATWVITGNGTVAVVVNVKSALTAWFPDPSTDTAW
jgi:hypothetical protein